MMNSPILYVFNVVITPWKLIGYLGVLLFAGRWVVQVLATRKQGKPVIPALFWVMSIGGSALLCAYFIWGKNDSVGLISNLFPMAVAVFNLVMDLRSRPGLRTRSVQPMHRDDHVVGDATFVERHQ
jgi:lipid-A-disaccharide synthase-like uncharacterized protein